MSVLPPFPICNYARIHVTRMSHHTNSPEIAVRNIHRLVWRIGILTWKIGKNNVKSPNFLLLTVSESGVSIDC